jgi:hypothetical protein
MIRPDFKGLDDILGACNRPSDEKPIQMTIEELVETFTFFIVSGSENYIKVLSGDHQLSLPQPPSAQAANRRTPICSRERGSDPGLYSHNALPQRRDQGRHATMPSHSRRGNVGPLCSW